MSRIVVVIVDYKPPPQTEKQNFLKTQPFRIFCSMAGPRALDADKRPCSTLA